MHFLAIASALAALAAGVRGTQFVKPGPNTDGDNVIYAQNSQYKVGQTVPITWESNWTTFDLYLLLEYPCELSVQLAGNTTAKNFDWVVGLDNYSTNIPDGEDYVFWFTLDSYDDNHVTQDNDDSMFFNVSAPAKPLSRGAITGIAAGSTAAGLTIIFGFIIWKLLKELKHLRAWKSQVEQQSVASPNSYYYSGDHGHSQMYQPMAPSVIKTEVHVPGQHELLSPPTPREMYVGS